MKIIVDPNRLKLTSHNNIVGVIYVQMEDVFFPDADWYDFPVRILGWWSNNLFYVIQNCDNDFLFMDGPFGFSLKMKNENDILISFHTDRKETLTHSTSLVHFTKELIQASQLVLDKASQNEWHNTDIDVLLRELTKLRSLQSSLS
jgi:hypothetical protein